MTSAAFQNLIKRGLLADRPEAGVPGRLYLTTDEGEERLYRDSGTSWELFEPAGSITEHSSAEDPHGDRAYTDSELATHAADTTAVHGITDTAALVVTTDSRLSDTRTPTDGTVTTAKIASSAVTTAKVADAAITEAKIADSSITSAKIANGTIVDADISSSAAIAPSKVSGTAVITTDTRLSDTRTPTDGTVTTAKIVDGAVTSAKIADGTIVNADISASAAIAPSKIDGTAVVTSDSRLSDSRTPTGSAGGSLSGTYPNPTIASGAVDTSQIASNAVTSGKLATGAVTSTKIASSAISDTHVASDAAIAQSKVASLTTDLAARELTANKGVASGYASLDGSGKVPTTQLPALAITSTSVVSSQSAMLALTGQTGDVAVRTDLSKSFILAGSDPTQLADWQELLTPTDAVASVDGRTGVVSLSDLYDAAGAAASAQSAAEGYADSAVSAHSGDADPHGDRAYADGLISDHEEAADPHSQYLTSDEADALYDAIGSASSAQSAAESYADSAVSTHNDSTSAHGITDTADLVYTDDARLSDARTPTAHATTHETGGTDELTPADIGAATSGHDHDADYSDIAHDHDTAYDALGAASSAQSAAEGYADGLISAHNVTTDIHGIADTADLVLTDDSRLTDARTPTAHATTHAIGGGDELDPADIGAATSGHDHDTAYAALGHDHDADYAAIGHDHDADYDALGAAASAQSAAEGYADSAVSTHNSSTSAHGITDTGDLVYTDDSRLSDARTPTAHASTHETGGSDELTPTDIGAAEAGHTHEGLMPGGHASTHAIGGTDELTPAAIGASDTTHDHDADYDAIGSAASAQSAAESYADGLIAALTAADVNAVATSAVGAASGVASLDGAGKVPTTQLPGITITSTTVVANQSAMLALSAETGDVAVRSDLNKTFILAGDDPTDLADWQELLTPTDAVASVDGRTGVVSLSDLYDAAGSASSAQSAAEGYADGLVGAITPASIGAAEAGHDHDADYAAIGHDHDADYDAIGAAAAAQSAAEGYADSAVSTHSSDTTSVHGITDTANLVVTSDARLSDARTPTAHKTSHATGGTDALSASDIGAAASSHNHDADYADIAHTHALDDLSDVTAATPSNGQALVWNATTSVWEPGTVSAGAADLDDLTDVTITSPADGQVLTYDNDTSTWINAAASGGAVVSSATPQPLGASGSAGTSADASRADHVHIKPSAADIGAVGTSDNRVTKGQFVVGWDAGDLALTANRVHYLPPAPVAGTITDWTVLADQSGSATFEVWKDTLANYPPTAADKISGSSGPALSSATSATSSSLTGWTTSVSAGDVLAIKLVTVSGAKQLKVVLSYTK